MYPEMLLHFSIEATGLNNMCARPIVRRIWTGASKIGHIAGPCELLRWNLLKHPPQHPWVIFGKEMVRKLRRYLGAIMQGCGH